MKFNGKLMEHGKVVRFSSIRREIIQIQSGKVRNLRIIKYGLLQY